MVYKIYGLYDGDALRYIGFTRKTLDERLITHKQAANKKGKQCHRICWLQSMKLRNKIVTIKLLDTAPTLEAILVKEIEWIAQCRLDGADLVNTCSGGRGSNGYKWTAEFMETKVLKVKQYSIKGELIAIHNSISDAAEKITGSRKNNTKLSLACRGGRGRRTAFGFVWRYIDDTFNKYPVAKQINITQAQREAISIRQTENNVMKGRTGKLSARSSAVYQLNDDKEIIASFDSMNLAMQQTGITSISPACIKGYKAGGFYWKYQEKI